MTKQIYVAATGLPLPATACRDSANTLCADRFYLSFLVQPCAGDRRYSVFEEAPHHSDHHHVRRNRKDHSVDDPTVNTHE